MEMVITGIFDVVLTVCFHGFLVSWQSAGNRGSWPGVCKMKVVDYKLLDIHSIKDQQASCKKQHPLLQMKI